jgi:hypothetical protein
MRREDETPPALPLLPLLRAPLLALESLCVAISGAIALCGDYVPHMPSSEWIHTSARLIQHHHRRRPNKSYT